MIPDRLQYFWEHFWNDQKCDQLWTLGPHIHHQNTSNNTRKSMGTSLKYEFSYLRICNSEICGRCLCPTCLIRLNVFKFWKLEHNSLVFWTFKNKLLEIGNWIWHVTFWNFEILKSWNFENMHREMMKIPLKNLQNLRYEFHIYQEHEKEIW